MKKNEKASPTLEKAAAKVRGMKERKDPTEVLRYIHDHYSDIHYPIKHCVLFSWNDPNYTVGDLIRDTLKEARRKENG